MATDPRDLGPGQIQDRAKNSGGTIVLLKNGETATVDTTGITTATDTVLTFTVSGGALTVAAADA